jgi:hypothetical protein
MTQKRKERRLQAGKRKSLEFSDSKSFFLSFFDSPLFYMPQRQQLINMATAFQPQS